MIPGPRLIVLQPTPYCNVQCSYCYLSHRDDRRLMPVAVVDAVCEKIVSRLAPDSALTVAWHAGEPTAAPIKWYERACERLLQACPACTTFLMQTNGLAIDGRWIELFRRTRMQVNLSIDGPQRFHDARRRTRSGGKTWSLAIRGLRRLQAAGFAPGVITVLHPEGIDHPDEYYRFYRDHELTDVGLSIDETEGANKSSSFADPNDKSRMTRFMTSLLEQAFRDQFPLRVREIERIARILAGEADCQNEQVEAWQAIVVAADGSVSTFSPEFMEVSAPEYGDFVFGNILTGNLEDFAATSTFLRAQAGIAAGVAACRSQCRYFAACGGGAPVNKLCESDDLAVAETAFCRCTTQASADALLGFMATRAGLPQYRTREH
jgi:uncharacterized protein